MISTPSTGIVNKGKLIRKIVRYSKQLVSFQDKQLFSYGDKFGLGEREGNRQIFKIKVFVLPSFSLSHDSGWKWKDLDTDGDNSDSSDEVEKSSYGPPPNYYYGYKNRDIEKVKMKNHWVSSHDHEIEKNIYGDSNYYQGYQTWSASKVDYTKRNTYEDDYRTIGKVSYLI